MSSLATTFRDKLIPWSLDNLEQRLIVARPVMKKSSVPYGVEFSRKKIPGKRVLVRTHDDGPQKIVRARWPETGLHELYIPKLVCVLKGITDYQTGEYVITCGEGYFILLPPSTPNTTGGRSHLEGEHRKYGSCDLLQLLLFRDHIQCAVCSSRGEEHWEEGEWVISHSQTVYLFHLFMEEALNRQEDSDRLCSQLLSSVFTFLLREVKAGRQRKAAHVAPESTFGGEALQQIRDYVKTHLHQSLTIEKVAQQMYMSPSQFTRYVRRETGRSFVELLTECRIEETKRLLRETDWSIAAISRDVGFRSSTYFITLFGKHVGCSPGEYRSRLKNDLK